MSQKGGVDLGKLDADRAAARELVLWQRQWQPKANGAALVGILIGAAAAVAFEEGKSRADLQRVLEAALDAGWTDLEKLRRN